MQEKQAPAPPPQSSASNPEAGSLEFRAFVTHPPAKYVPLGQNKPITANFPNLKFATAYAINALNVDPCRCYFKRRHFTHEAERGTREALCEL